MAKKAKVYTGTEWVDLAAATTDLSQYPNMTTTSISGFRNAIINGGMDVWQRGSGGIVPTSAQPYSADRWESYRAGYAAGLAVYRPSGPTGIQYSARVQRDAGNTSTASIAFGQPIETSNSIRFRGKTVVLSFYARSGANFSSASSLLSVFLSTGTGTDQNFRNGFTGRVDVISNSATLTTSWQRFTYTGTIGSGISQVGVQFSYTPVGTAGAADHFEITGVQLEEGTIATPFEQRPIGTELSLCQRYFQIYVDPPLRGVSAGGTLVARTGMILPTPLRVAPSSSNIFSGTLLFWDGSAASSYTSIGTSYLKNTHVEFDLNVTAGLTGGRAVSLYIGGGGTMSLSAEL
jgi:hypothetical protein